MKLTFTIRYNTVWGESLCVDITYNRRDGSKRTQRLPMTTDDGQLWTLQTAVIESRQHPIDSFSYIYNVVDGDGRILRSEWDSVSRTLHFDSTKDYNFPDEWRDIPLQDHLYTKAYWATQGKIAACDDVRPLALPLFRRTMLFRVSAPQLLSGQSLAVCGSHPAVGCWNASRYILMEYAGQQEWMLTVNVAAMMGTRLEYKYVVVDNATHSLLRWEEGENRTADGSEVADGQVLVLDGGVLRLCETLWKAAGVAVPVFALRTEHSYGCGDFGDLRRMVDWAVATGMRIIQTLPVNDTTAQHDWMDSCPYNAISVFALHPHYVDIDAAGMLADSAKMTMFRRRRRELNALPYSDYEAVDRVKMEYLRQFFNEQRSNIVENNDYKAFVERNKEWLLPYAAFCTLRDSYGTADYHRWPRLSVYDKQAVAEYVGEESDEVAFTCYVQFLLHVQLKNAADYAHSHGVALMGDLPICVSRNSVETWMHPDYFNSDASAGTPPDFSSHNGQNWCAPTYNWNNIMADDCRWWHCRLSHIEQYFDALRIDHILGYFRIWEIPNEAVHGQLGHFSPSLPMTEGEIETYGLRFRKDLYTRPFINDRILSRLFGVHAQYVRDTFLKNKSYNMYDLKPEYDTQRKIQRFFEGKNDENSLWIRDGLYRLVADVLFVEDLRRPAMYHPRIEAYKEPIYEALEAEDKEAFMRLYNNYYYQRHGLFWGNKAMCRLPKLLCGTRMLITAEDLGMLPDCVEPVLDALRILTLEVQTMPKQGGGYEFAHLNANPYRSVATFSTHDTAPMRLWWEDNHELAQRYYATMMQKEGHAPEHLTAPLAEEIVARHLYCPSMLCVMPLQDWLAMDMHLQPKNPRQERINTPSDHYNRWQYRMTVTIDELLHTEMLNRKINTMITRSKR